MSEQNKAVVRRSFEQVWTNGDLTVLEEIYAADVITHNDPPGFPSGIEGTRASVTMYRTAFPNTKIEIEDQIAKGDKVVTRWTATGTHQGELMGMPPTGKPVKVAGITIDRLKDGKIVEYWSNFDQVGMMQQLGAMPS